MHNILGWPRISMLPLAEQRRVPVRLRDVKPPARLLGSSRVAICTAGWARCQCALGPLCQTAALPQPAFCRMGKVSLRLRDVVSKIAHKLHQENFLLG